MFKPGKLTRLANKLELREFRKLPFTFLDATLFKLLDARFEARCVNSSTASNESRQHNSDDQHFGWRAHEMPNVKSSEALPAIMGLLMMNRKWLRYLAFEPPD